jgi:uncharacterized membrane protein
MQVMTKITKTRALSPRVIRRRKITVYAIILSLTLLWCVLFVSVPFLAEGNPPARRLAAVITLFFSFVCHQAAERSFHLMGHPLAVCVRCTGIYLGFLLGVILYPLIRDWNDRSLPPRKILWIGLLPSALEFGVFRLLLNVPDPFFRAFSGLILGAVVSLYVIPGLFSAFHIHQSA